MGFATSNNFKKPQQKRTGTFIFYILIMGVLVLGIASQEFFGNEPESTELALVYNKPNVNMASTSVKVSQKPPANYILPILTVVLKTTEIPVRHGQQYGIAAGGGLALLPQKELEQYFMSLQSLGVQWIRWDIDWSVVQPENSVNYKWEGVDRVAIIAKQYGINSLGIITYTPKWATSPNCLAKSHCEPADPKEFGRFSGKVALRYKNLITHWEIWNEPNYAFFWGPKPNAEKYSEVLKESYLAIKKANPSAIVLSGGLASAGDKGDGSIPPLTFAKALYELGANEYFDILAIHPYTYPASPTYQAWWNRWQEILPIRKLMVDNGDSIKKIWITEIGVPTGGPGRAYATNQAGSFKYGSDFMYEKAQVDIMKESIDFYQKNIDWMGPFFWYSLKDASNKKNDTENFFGLLRYSGSKKPAYEVFKNIIASSTKNVVHYDL